MTKFAKYSAGVIAACLILGGFNSRVYAAATPQENNTVSLKDFTAEQQQENDRIKEILSAAADTVTVVQTAAYEKVYTEQADEAAKRLGIGEDADMGQAVIDYALQFVGNPYRYGKSSLTKGTDCSGFTMSVYAHFGVKIPHASVSQRDVGYEVSVEDMRPGDIVCYKGHVALYMGDGRIVHASSRRTGIKISDNVFYKKILTVRRIF